MTPTHKEGHVLSARNHTIELALSQSPEQLASILAEVRKYRKSLSKTLTLRASRYDKLIRERSEQLAAAHAQQHANRTKRMAVLSQVPVVKSIAALHTSLAQQTGKTARHAYLKQQLNVYKYAHHNEEDRIRFSVQGVTRTPEQLQQLLESFICNTSPTLPIHLPLRLPASCTAPMSDAHTTAATTQHTANAVAAAHTRNANCPHRHHRRPPHHRPVAATAAAARCRYDAPHDQMPNPVVLRPT